METESYRKTEEGESKTSSLSCSHVFGGKDDGAGFQNRSSWAGKGDGSSRKVKVVLELVSPGEKSHLGVL